VLLVTRLGVYRRTRMDAPRTNSGRNTNLERRQQVLESLISGREVVHARAYPKPQPPTSVPLVGGAIVALGSRPLTSLFAPKWV
jgi:hypothetical protein